MVDPDFEGGSADLCYRRISDWSNQVEAFRDDRAFRLMAVVLLLDAGSDKVFSVVHNRTVPNTLSST